MAESKFDLDNARIGFLRHSTLFAKIAALCMAAQKPPPLGPAPGLKGRMRNKRNPATGQKYKHEQ